jgi:hypothetical protein
MGLAIIHNQLVMIDKANGLLMKKNQGDFIIQEMFISFGLISSILREAITYLHHTNDEPEILNFLSEIPKKTRDKYEYLSGLFKEDNDKQIYDRMSKLRNTTFHFSKPNDRKNKELTNAIEAKKNEVIYYDGDSDYFNFAISISNYIFMNSLFSREEIENEEYENSEKAVRRIQDSFKVFIEFSNEVVRYYIKF